MDSGGDYLSPWRPLPDGSFVSLGREESFHFDPITMAVQSIGGRVYGATHDSRGGLWGTSDGKVVRITATGLVPVPVPDADKVRHLWVDEEVLVLLDGRRIRYPDDFAFTVRRVPRPPE